MSLSQLARREILITRGQRTEAHREARDLGYGNVVDAVEKFVPRDSDELALELMVLPRGPAAIIRMMAWIGDRSHGFERDLTKLQVDMLRERVFDLVKFEVDRMLAKVGEAIVRERIEWKGSEWKGPTTEAPR